MPKVTILRYCVGLIIYLGLFSGLDGVRAQTTGPAQPNLPSDIKVTGSFCSPSANTACGGGAVTFTDSRTDAVGWNWQFQADPLGPGSATGTTGTGTTRTVTHQFSRPGSYSITLVRSLVGGGTETRPFSVTVGQTPDPFPQWKADTTICKGEVLTLDPYMGASEPGYTYKWAPKGQTTQALSVTESGCYSVEVKNDGCPYEDLIHVDVCFEPPGSPAAKWHFGSNAGLDFSGGAPQPLPDSKLNTKEGASSMSNSKGELLFYTDGINVYDVDGNLMPTFPASTSTTSTSLGGSQFSTQSALIVPKPTCRGCEYLFYVYTTSEINGNKQLTYSIVDMRENNGKGAITAQNLPVTADPTVLSTERSAAVENEADTTYWVVTHDFGNNVFRITHLTRSGTPTQTTVSAGMSQTSTAQAEGYMKFGPAPDSASANSGTATGGSSNTAVRPLAVVVPGPPTNYIELYDFNMDSGDLTYKRTIDLGPAPPKAYGVEFSPDGKKLFVTLLGDPVSGTGAGASSSILQYDLTKTDSTELADSKTEIATSTTQQFGALQMGADGRIYVAIPGATSLGVIENPNATFLDSLRFIPNGQQLGGKQSQLGLPNQVANFNSPPSSSPGLDHDGECVGEDIQFNIGPFCQKLKETYTLDFGDSTAPKTFTSAQPQTHVYRTPGVYLAKLTIVTRKNAPQGQTGEICSVTTVTDSVKILAVPPSFSLGPDQVLCQNSVVLTIPASASASNYAWIRSNRIISRAKSYTATQTGTYIGVVFNSVNCPQFDTIQVVFTRPQLPAIAPDTVFCIGSPHTLSVVTNAADRTYKWSNGGTEKTTQVTASGVYSVTWTYERTPGVTCVASNSITVRAVPKPRLAAALTGPTGCTTTDGAINLTPTPVGSYSYVWSRSDGGLLPSTSNQLLNVGEGAYKVRATNEALCALDSSFALKSPANPLSASTLSTSALCSIPNSGSIALNNIRGNPTSYSWRDVSGAIVSQEASFTGAAAGTYVLEISDAGGCRLSIPNIPVGLDPRGFAALPPLSQACLGETLSLTPSGASLPGNTFQWSTGATTPTISVSAPGSFSITIRNTLNGCIGSASTNVTFSPKPTVSAGPALSLCVGQQPVQLTGNSPAGGAWSGSPNLSPTGSFTPSTALVGTNISVTYSVTQNGCANAAIRTLNVQPAPQVSAGPDVEFCANATRPIQVSGTTGATFRWSDGTEGAIIRPTTSGTLVVTASLNGCTITDDVGVRIKPIPQFSFTKEAALCIGDGESTSLVVRGTSGLSYSWPDVGSSASAITVNRSGSYSLVVTNTENCVVREVANVQDRCEPRVFIPEAFTPNGDNINDMLQIFTAYTVDFELRIYNRWGEVVFVSNSPEQKWDGSYKGTAYPPMVYAYTVTYGSQYFPERPRVTKRGSIALIR